jgi:hypothetical protein
MNRVEYTVTLRFTINGGYAAESHVLQELEDSVEWLKDHGAIRVIEQLRENALPRLVYVAEDDDDV